MQFKKRHPFFPAVAAPLQGTRVKNKEWPECHPLCPLGWHPFAGYNQFLE